MSKRIDWIDVAKGILIVLVVLGHSHISTTVVTAINSFHMASFFTLSGLTFRSNSSFRVFAVKKVKSLLIPYLAFSAILLLYQFIKAIFFAEYHFNFLSGVISVIIPISGRTTTTVYGLWFFPCLFLTELLVNVLYAWYKKSALKTFVGFSLICVLCIGSYHIWRVASILSVLPIAVFFIGFGILLQSKTTAIEKYKVGVCVACVIVFIAAVIGNYSYYAHTVDLSSMHLGNWGLYLLSCVSGTLAIITLSMMLHRLKLLQKLGMDSMYYYGLHYEFLGLIEKIVPVGGRDTHPAYILSFNSSCGTLQKGLELGDEKK